MSSLVNDFPLIDTMMVGENVLWMVLRASSSVVASKIDRMCWKDHSVREESMVELNNAF